MPKNSLVIGAVIVVIVAAIGGYLFLNKNKTPGDSMMEEQSGGVMESVGDILSSNKSLECNYVDPQRGTVVAYVKGGKVRVNYTAPEENNSGSVIIKDKMMYFWNNQGAFKMAVPDEEEMQEAQESIPQGQQSAEDVVRDIESYKDSCKEASVSDSQFDLPAGVTFQDFSSMMEGMMEEQQGSTGGQTPSIDPKYQELMEQYSNPQ